MSNIIVKAIIIAVALPAYFHMSNSQKESAIEDYNLNVAEQSVFLSCRSNMKYKEMKFNKGANVTKGCACFAKNASTDLTPEQYSIVGDVLSTKLSFAKKAMKTTKQDEQIAMLTDMMTRLEEIQADSNLSEDNMMTVLSKTTDLIGLCGDRKNHTDENIAQWTGLPSQAVVQTVSVQKSDPIPALRK